MRDGDIIERNGFRFLVNIEQDDTSDAPWERCDGHEPISESVTRAKAPGEWVLYEEHGRKLYYDAAEATRIAKRDGWGLAPDKLAVLERSLGRKPTRKQIIAEVVRCDFDYLRRWCDNQWCYVGVIVTHIPDDCEADEVEKDYANALWGIGSDETDTIAETANELAGDKARELNAERDGENETWARNMEEMRVDMYASE